MQPVKRQIKKNWSTRPEDNIPDDEREQERIDEQKHQELIEPKLIDEETEEGTDTKASEKTEAEYPQASFTAWYKQLEGFAECQREYKIQLAETMLNAAVFPALAATTQNAWLFIRQGLESTPELKIAQKELDEKIDAIIETAAVVGNAVQSGRKVSVFMYVTDNKGKNTKFQPVWEGIKDVRWCWNKIFFHMDKLGLTIRFHRKAKWEGVLDKRQTMSRSGRKNLVEARGGFLEPITRLKRDAKIVKRE